MEDLGLSWLPFRLEDSGLSWALFFVGGFRSELGTFSWLEDLGLSWAPFKLEDLGLSWAAVKLVLNFVELLQERFQIKT